MNKQYKVGVVGATGIAGMELVKLLFRRKFPFSDLRLFATSHGYMKLPHHMRVETIEVSETTEDSFTGLDIVFFATPASVSERLVPIAIREGCIVIDKSSAFRMKSEVPLVVPGINDWALSPEERLVASPNCMTAIMLMGVYPLHRAFGLKRLIVSTYQSVSGSGNKGVQALQIETRRELNGDESGPTHYSPHPIAFNCIPVIDALGSDGYSGEEIKLILETRKIMGMPTLPITATCVRVPVFRGHGASVTCEFADPVNLKKAEIAIRIMEGISLINHGAFQPTQATSEEVADCSLSRLRKDHAFENALSFWVVGDNLWRGAALNALQIAEKVIAL